MLSQLEMEKKRGEELSQMKKASQDQCWWEAPVDQLNLPQLEQLKGSLEELKKNVTKQADRLLIQSSNPSQFFASSSNGGILPFDRMKFGGFNPSIMPLGYNVLGYGRKFF